MVLGFVIGHFELELPIAQFSCPGVHGLLPIDMHSSAWSQRREGGNRDNKKHSTNLDHV